MELNLQNKSKTKNAKNKFNEFVNTASLSDLFRLKNKINLQTDGKIGKIKQEIYKLIQEIKILQNNHLENNGRLKNHKDLITKIIHWICYLQGYKREIEKNRKKLIEKIDTKINLKMKIIENQKIQKNTKT